VHPDEETHRIGWLELNTHKPEQADIRETSSASVLNSTSTPRSL
jgi:hypothetical protein